MKDQDEIWVVLREGAPLSTAIRCDLGKGEAKNLRKKMKLQHGGEWMSKKMTQKELAKG